MFLNRSNTVYAPSEVPIETPADDENITENNEAEDSFSMADYTVSGNTNSLINRQMNKTALSSASNTLSKLINTTTATAISKKRPSQPSVKVAKGLQIKDK